MAGVLVTGTDTGVGKTVVSAALIAAARREGLAVRPLKPVLTGSEESEVEPDHALLGRLAGIPAQEVTLFAFPFPASPHLASALAGAPLDAAEVERRSRAAIEAALGRGESVVVEGVGGLLVPLANRYTLADLAVALSLPVVVVARAELGTINHTLLTLEAARRRGLQVAGVVLNRFPQRPGPIEADNLRTVATLGEVAVTAFPVLEAIEPEALCAAAQELPWRSWLAAG